MCLIVLAYVSQRNSTNKHHQWWWSEKTGTLTNLVGLQPVMFPLLKISLLVTSKDALVERNSLAGTKIPDFKDVKISVF